MIPFRTLALIALLLLCVAVAVEPYYTLPTVLAGLSAVVLFAVLECAIDGWRKPREPGE